MPSEIRRIIFTNTEATKAILAYGARFDVKFPIGKITRARAAGTNEFQDLHMHKFHSELHTEYNIAEQKNSVIITFFDELTFEHRYFDLRADFITAALIVYCRENQIMIPRNSLKKLGFSDLNMTLDIHYELRLSGSDPLLELE